MLVKYCALWVLLFYGLGIVHSLLGTSGEHWGRLDRNFGIAMLGDNGKETTSARRIPKSNTKILIVIIDLFLWQLLNSLY